MRLRTHLASQSMWPVKPPAWLIALCVSASVACGQGPIQRIPHEAVPGHPAATVLQQDRALIHTDLVLPLNEAGEVADDEPAAQAKRVVSNLKARLQTVDAGLDDLLKLQIYAADREALKATRTAIQQTFSEDQAPAVSGLIAAPAHAEARVGVDAIAAAPADIKPEGVTFTNVTAGSGGGDDGGTEFAELSARPSGSAVYFSGQVGRGENMQKAAEKNIETVLGRVEKLGLQREHVAHIKIFMQPIEKADAVREALKKAFPDRPVPPVTIVEWAHEVPIEMELVAYAPEGTGPKESSGRVAHQTPDWLKKSPTYCRFAWVQGGDPIFVSGLHARQQGDHEAEIRDIFEQLQSIIDKAGGDFDHLVKAQYFTLNKEPWGPLHAVRKEHYDPDRAPASTLGWVHGLGQPNRSVMLDMIAVTAPAK